ncbi:MAG: 23S rRNA (uracil(1939)-C(5))-methyltransferase RlmD [Bacteriovoracaceae bacterium]|nr:23S rRNA (uracil(1939)-C(5))-methyltransferase RlmD [Bacteriovoracaceae bacterium]
MIVECPHFKKKQCNSCSLITCKSYEDTLEEKVQDVAVFFPEINLSKVEKCDYISASRNKAKIAVGGTIDRPILGVTRSAGDINEVLNCPLHLDEINSVLQLIKEKIKEYNLTPYSIREKKGELKYILLYKSERSQEMMVRFVLRSKEALDRIRLLYQNILLKSFPNITVASVNIQPVHQAILEGSDEIILSKDSMIRSDLGGNTLYLAPKSFFQVTSHVAEKLYLKAQKCIDDSDSKNILDLFCGVGAFAFYSAKKGRKVVGVELSQEAIDCGLRSAKEANIDVEFVAQDATEFIKANKTKFDTVITNPPRRGLNSDIISKIIELDPELFLYSSCNPQSLRRDITELGDHFDLIELIPFDMFPLTNHLECLAVLKKKARKETK